MSQFASYNTKPENSRIFDFTALECIRGQKKLRNFLDFRVGDLPLSVAVLVRKGLSMVRRIGDRDSGETRLASKSSETGGESEEACVRER